MILDKKVNISLNGSNIKKYRLKYGDHLKIKDVISVDISDVSDYSNILITCRCEICNKDSVISKSNYTTNIKNGGYYGCKKCSRIKSKNTCVEKYGVENPFESNNIKEKIKITNLEKYGVENPFESNSIKEKIKITNLEKYGKEFYLQTEEYKEKSKITNIRNIGVEFPMQSNKIREKSKKTCLEKYGLDSYTKTDECKRRYKETCLEKYGVDSYTKTSECQEKMKLTCLERYGVPHIMQSYKFLKKSLKCKINSYNENLYYQGKYELDFLNICKKINIIDIVKRGPTIKYADGRIYFSDFYIEKYNLIVEVKSSYTYNLHKEKNENKRNACINRGYNFLFIVDKNYIEFLKFTI